MGCFTSLGPSKISSFSRVAYLDRWQRDHYMLPPLGIRKSPCTWALWTGCPSCSLPSMCAR